MVPERPRISGIRALVARTLLASVGALGLAQCSSPTSEQAVVTRAPEPGPPVVVARVPLRRLSRVEYDNTVRDLLGDTTHPASAFPPDEAVSGFESNNVAPVTPALVERYMDAAEALASRALARLGELAPCATPAEHQRCAEAFIERFGRRVYRRPLHEDERAALLAVYSEKQARSDYAGGIQLVLETLLQSPQFLYRVEPLDDPDLALRPLNGYEIATRLSYFIWASTPDDALLDEAGAGRLATQEDVTRVARRMLADPRAVDGIRSFHRQWLGLRELETESKDGTLAAAFTPELRDAMVEETLRFSAHAVQAGGDTLATLLTSKQSFLNAPLAKLYGVPAPSGDGFALVDLPASQRSGLLTHASVMTVLSSGDQTSPILRGKFVRERLLCHAVPPPPPSAALLPPKVDPKRTTKERFAQHRADPACAGCHVLMDPIGFGFEHYDAIGAWRTADGPFPVDAVGELTLTDDADGDFDGAVELGARLARSEQVRRCMATQWLRFALGRSERDEDDASLASAYRAFAGSGFDVRELIVGIATSDVFRHGRFEEGSAQ